MTQQTLFPFLLATAALFAACNSTTAGKPSVAPPVVQAATDAGPPDAIPPVDPIWNAMVNKQAYLDKVERIRTGDDDAFSCQKVGHTFPHRIVVDTSRCNPIQLRLEQDAAHQQMFDKMVKTLRHND